MNIPLEQYRQAADYIRAHLTGQPEVCLVLGSGLGRLADEVEDAVRIPYADIPGFPVQRWPPTPARCCAEGSAAAR